ncbi:hypothetical protein [Roseibium sediminicola]|uniref:Uncharacterized protein n=1 Tax=Roseibium sediminicola TaxID=2933272 RepID=A0ABT0GT88_9HYPH|nr:hypothetical protein [Roseibium sp. CAU 1639]MCK7612647.1 hypothetical protein [Roseibium sp. CAU 1639]
MMAQSRQTQLILDLLEGLPSIGFILLWRQTGDLELAGWIGSGLAATVFAAFALLKGRMHPVLLGVNCHILLVTPLIVGLFRFGGSEIATLLVPYSYGAVLLTVTLVGVLLTLFTRSGFAGIPELTARLRLRLSLMMIAVSAAGTAWALSAPDKALLPVVATLTLLIVGRRFLLARWADGAAGAVVLAGSALAGTGQPDSLA